jgi:hypothetical protein
MTTALKLKNEWISWVSNNFEYTELSASSIRIDTPFYDRHNDTIILYAIKKQNNWRLTDGGYIIDDLAVDGIVFDNRTRTRNKYLEQQLFNYGVSFDSTTNELYTDATYENFAIKKAALMQAMLFVNDMFLTKKEAAKSFFLEDVSKVLDSHELNYISPHIVVDSIGMNHNFEYAFSGKGGIPSKVIKLINTPNNEMYAKSVLTDFTLAQPRFNKDTKKIVLFNDNNAPSTGVINNMFEENDIETYRFSKDRNNLINTLTSA